MRLQDAEVLPGPAPTSNMTATCHAGPPSWVKNSGSLLYLFFLVVGENECTGYRLKSGSYLTCMKLGPTPTNNLHLVLINRRIENSREGRWESFGQPLPSLGYRGSAILPTDSQSTVANTSPSSHQLKSSQASKQREPLKGPLRSELQACWTSPCFGTGSRARGWSHGIMLEDLDPEQVFHSP